MIVLLTEEASMRAVLGDLIRRYFPEKREHVEWKIVVYSGKSDLEKRFPTTMRGWNWGDPTFVVIRDNDGGDCVALKQRLASLASATGRNFRVRIVCQELEGWLLGDAEAVRAAYPRCRFSNEKARYRDPDRLTNAAEELSKLTLDRTKERRAGRIAPHLEPGRNRSQSFHVLFRTLGDLLG